MVHREAGLLHESLRVVGDCSDHLSGWLPVWCEWSVDNSFHRLLHCDYVPDVHVCADEDLRR